MESAVDELAGAERRAWWQRHIEGQRQSGLTGAAYCRQQGLKTWRLSYWRKALAMDASPAGGFVELTAAKDALQVECGGCQIVLRRGFDPELLRAVVATLRSA